MFNILVGSFTTESNTNVPYITKLGDYELCFNDEVIDKMGLNEINRSQEVRLLPLVYANANAASLVEYETFIYIENLFLHQVKNNLSKIDGIYLHLHGGSYVEKIGSGDHHLLKEIRKIVGPYLPIAISCDPHGNLTEEYATNCTIIRSYRESPHVDAASTRVKVLNMLIDLLFDRQNIHAIYRKLPLILGGEQSVSADEPVLSINKYMDEMEKDARIRSVSWHVGYLRHDCPEAGCGVIVVPNTYEDIKYCESKADELAKFVWDRRHEFHYTGLTLGEDESIDMALNFMDKPFVITDSGDNTTSGASGWNTTLLRKLLQKNNGKKMLFASIKDEECFKYLKTIEEDEITDIKLGNNFDKNCQEVYLKIQKKKTAPIYMAHGEVTFGTLGEGILVHVLDTNIDIIVAEKTGRITNGAHLDVFGIKWQDYDIVILKQGYIFPDFKKDCKGYVMALTDGNTLQDTKNINFKLIMRPMYPIDNI